MVIHENRANIYMSAHYWRPHNAYSCRMGSDDIIQLENQTKIIKKKNTNIILMITTYKDRNVDKCWTDHRCNRAGTSTPVNDCARRIVRLRRTCYRTDLCSGRCCRWDDRDTRYCPGIRRVYIHLTDRRYSHGNTNTLAGHRLSNIGHFDRTVGSHTNSHRSSLYIYIYI